MQKTTLIWLGMGCLLAAACAGAAETGVGACVVKAEAQFEKCLDQALEQAMSRQWSWQHQRQSETTLPVDAENRLKIQDWPPAAPEVSGQP